METVSPEPRYTTDVINQSTEKGLKKDLHLGARTTIKKGNSRIQFVRQKVHQNCYAQIREVPAKAKDTESHL